MTFTYDRTLPTDRDWVRFLIGDTTDSTNRLQDEEIDAVLREEPNKYLAAARCGERIFELGFGAVSKSVEGLSLSYSDSPEGAFRSHLQKLREKGAEVALKTTGSHVFRVLG
jgi:hypothetical protein